MKTGERLFREACKAAEANLRRLRQDAADVIRRRPVPIPVALKKDVALLRRWRKALDAANRRIQKAGYYMEGDTFRHGYEESQREILAAQKPIDVALHVLPTLKQKYAAEFFTSDPSLHAGILRHAMAELGELYTR